jgi:hypothetical protein
VKNLIAHQGKPTQIEHISIIAGKLDFSTINFYLAA